MSTSRFERRYLFASGKLAPRKKPLAENPVLAVHVQNQLGPHGDPTVPDHAGEIHDVLHAVPESVRRRIAWRLVSDRDADYVEGVGWVSHLRLVFEEA